MNTVLGCMILVASLGSIVFNSVKFGRRFMVPNLIIGLWGTCEILSMMGFYNMFVPGPETYIIILAFLMVFEAFSVLINGFFEKRLVKRWGEKSDSKKWVNSKLVKIVLMVGAVIGAALCMKSVGMLINGGGFSEIRDTYLFEEGAWHKVNMLISLVFIPVVSAFGYLATVEAVENRKIRLPLVLFGIFILEMAFYTGGRGILVNFLLLAIIALADQYNFNLKKIFKNNKKLVMAGLILILIMIFITLRRNLSGGGLIYNIYAYFVGSIHLFGQYLQKPELHGLVGSPLLGGAILFSGIIYPITFVMRLFGSDVKAGLYILNETTQNFEAISPMTMINNNTTFLYSAIRDFGTIGIVLYTFLIVLAFNYLLYRKREKNTVFAKAAFYVFVVNEFFLLFDFGFSNTGLVIMMAVFLGMDFYYERKKMIKEELKNELISVIVPIYNVKKYVENCVESIMKQTYGNIEIILVDDGSTDGSGKICDKMAGKDERIKVFHKENGGLSDARNFGIRKTRGKYLVFVDGDDDMEKDGIEYLYLLVKRYKTRMAIAAQAIRAGKKTHDEGKNQIEEKISTEEGLKRLLMNEGFSTSTGGKIYERELFDEIEFPKGKICEDNGTIYRLILECPGVAYGNVYVYNYYKRKNSIMTSEFDLRKLDLVELVDKMGKDILEKYPKLEKEVERRKVVARFSLLRQILTKAKLTEEEKAAAEGLEVEVKKRKWRIIFGPEYTFRDRMALFALTFGKKLFASAWRLYARVRY